MGEIEARSVNMIARLFNAPLDDPNSEAMGVSTVGSSEASMLAVLAAKRRWQLKRRAEGKSVSFSLRDASKSSADLFPFRRRINQTWSLALRRKFVGKRR